MQDKIAQEVQNALTTSTEEILLEQIQDENSSPLNQPVIEKDIEETGIQNDREKQKTWNVWKPGIETASVKELNVQENNTANDFRSQVEANLEHERLNEPLDAPEQEINNNDPNDDDDDVITDAAFEVPLSQANQAADALLGMTNNVLAVGGGYFVKIGKHKEFYEFEEIIKVIDEQNKKNVQRIKLDKEDQALLRPLLAQVLRKKAKKLSPEQQLMGAVISILIKKAQIVMEVRAENNLLEDRILDIIREEKGECFNSEEQETLAEEELEIKGPPTSKKAKNEENIPQETKQTVQKMEVEELDDDFSILEVAEPKIDL